MKIKTNNSRRGFSLVELLLTLVLILCLAAASVFTFTAIFRSANLDEGLDRFQSLIRFAQADAATTGRKVRLQFVPVSSEEGEFRTIQVTWEADLLNAPGVFQAYTNKAWSEDVVNELIAVQKVQTLQSPNSSAGHRGGSAAPRVEDEGMEEEFPSITFYPDGSCDSAEIVLASRNSDDQRRLAVRLSGLLGTVSTRTITSEHDLVEAEALEAEFDEYNELFEMSQPIAEFSY